MRRLLTIAGVSLVALQSGAAAQAAGPDVAGPWVDAFVPGQTMTGLRTDGSMVPAPRSMPQNAVGVAETSGGQDDPATPPTAFYSLGIGGTLVLQFVNTVCNANGPLPDLDVREVTFAPPDPGYPAETARVSVSQDGLTYVVAASAINRDSVVSIPAALPTIRYIKLEDTTNPLGYHGRPTPGDGIDIDGVRALDIFSCSDI